MQQMMLPNRTATHCVATHTGQLSAGLDKRYMHRKAASSPNLCITNWQVLCAMTGCKGSLLTHLDPDDQPCCFDNSMHGCNLWLQAISVLTCFFARQCTCTSTWQQLVIGHIDGHVVTGFRHNRLPYWATAVHKQAGNRAMTGFMWAVYEHYV